MMSTLFIQFNMTDDNREFTKGSVVFLNFLLHFGHFFLLFYIFYY